MPSLVELFDPSGCEDRQEVGTMVPKRNGTAPKLVKLADVSPKPIRWLWPSRVPIGKLTLINGDPGLGKSMLTADLASRVSTGMGWPDDRNARSDPGGVVFLSAEDDIADTIRPRLDAAGADVTRIVAIQGVEYQRKDSAERESRAFNLASDLPALEIAIRSVQNCKLVIVDPVSAFLGKVDSHKNAEVRAMLGPLSDLAAKHGVAVVAVTHLTKAPGGKALYRSTGSLAFTAAARSAWLVVADKTNPLKRLLLCIKSNLAKLPNGLSYEIESKSIGPVEDVPYLLWGAEPVNITANEALSQDEEGGRDGKVNAVVEWLRGELADGPVASDELKDRGAGAGYGWKSLRTAQQRIGIKPRKAGFGGSGKWLWELPIEDTAVPLTPTTGVLGTLGSEAQNDDYGVFEDGSEEVKTAFTIAPA